VAGLQSWPAGAAAAEWRAHWTLVLAAMLGFSVVGMSIYSLGAFFVPLHKEFGWDRTLISSGTMVYATTSLLCQFGVGWMIDRWGARRIALVGVILSAVAFALFATADGSRSGWLLLWLVYSLSIQLMLTATWSSAVASEFEAGRGLALAFTLGGSAVSGAVAPIAATTLIAAYGWRTAYVVIGFGVGAVVFLTSWLFFYSRSDRLRSTASAMPEAADLPGLTLAEAVRSPAFYKLSFGIFFGYVMTIAVLVHMLPILEADGLKPTQAAGIAAFFGIFAMVGKLICGALVNRFPGHLIAAAGAAVPIAGYLILMTPGQPVLMLALAVSLIGTSGGAQLKMIVYLTTRYFGMRAFGAIFGFIGSALTISGGAGPLIGGYMFDRFGDYHLMLALGIPLSILGCLMMLWTGDYPEVRAARALARQAAA
jgi:MFS family permease